MSEVWSISITDGGIGAAAVNETAEYRQSHREFARSSCTAEELYRAVDECLHGIRGDQLPEAVALTSCPGAVYTDGRGNALTPVFFSLPLTVPRHDIPPLFAEEPKLLAVWRGSVLRRLQAAAPNPGMGRPVLCTPVSLLLRALVDQNADTLCPLGAPFYRFDDPMEWQAAGVDAENSVYLCRQGRAVGRVGAISPLPADASALDFWRRLLRGVPVFHYGSATAAGAYATAADPLSWHVAVGWRVSAAWTASATACAPYEIQIQSAEESKSEEDSASPEEMTRDGWTAKLAETLPLSTETGARHGDCAYLMRSPFFDSEFVALSYEHLKNRFEQSDGAPWFADDILSCAPLGSCGLHLWAGQYGIQSAGLENAHGCAHLVRAIFESQGYEIRRWRENTGISGLGPVRVSFAPPWDISAAQTLCDILGQPLIAVNLPAPAGAALGAAIAFMRDIEMLPKGFSPKVAAWQIAPTDSARLYDAHYAIHNALRFPDKQE